MIDHCVAMTVGTAANFYSYVVSDLPCPAGTPATACYGGYLLGAIAHGSLTRSTVGGVSTIAATIRSTVLERHWMPALPGGPPPREVYLMPSTPHVTLESTITIEADGSIDVGPTEVTDSSGTVFVEPLPSAMSWPSSLSCSDFADIVRGGVNLGADLAAGLVAGVGASHSVASGVVLGLLSGSSAVGFGIAGTGITLSLGLGAAISEAGESGSDFAGTLARELCEFLQAAQDFEPEDLPHEQNRSEEGSGRHHETFGTWDSDETTECENEGEWSCEGSYVDEDTGSTYTMYCKNQRNDSGDCERVCVGVRT
ncbi:MAG: hypothetical protein ACKV2T_39920 [Kofleriaceae bacterium]